MKSHHDSQDDDATFSMTKKEESKDPSSPFLLEHQKSIRKRVMHHKRAQLIAHSLAYYVADDAYTRILMTLLFFLLTH